MLVKVNIPNPNNLNWEELEQSELNRLSVSNELELRLSEIDKVKPINRIYVMGCGRSGTWLITAIMSTFKNIFIVPKELAVENFGIYTTTLSTLVLKRKDISYSRIDKIPYDINIAYIIRHPYDVLTSYNPTSKHYYHIQPLRWLNEMRALQYLIATHRPNTMIIRYEDLVTKPDEIQSNIARFFNLEIATSIDNFTDTFSPSPAAVKAMHGLRKIDTTCINKFKHDPKKVKYLRKIRPKLGQTLDWVGDNFTYDLTLQPRSKNFLIQRLMDYFIS